MKDLKMKKNVLQEIMDMCDEHESSSLKKHPKLQKQELPPVMENMDEDKEDSQEGAPSESQEQPLDEQKTIIKMESTEEDMDPEMMAKLLEMYKELKD